MAKGSCLCGGIEYEIEGDMDIMANCHCSMCRKNHAAPYVTYVGVKTANFRWTKGEDLIVDYQSSPNVHRGFCRVCGSNLPIPVAGEETLYVAAGTLDDDPGTSVQAHIYVASKASWHEITDDLPQFEEYPPGLGGEE